MARLLVLFAVFLLPVLVKASASFTIRGRVYCDTCRCGFETKATKYIAGAKVKIECIDRKSLQPAFSKEGETDSTGTYNIEVNGDQQDRICYAKLVSSPIRNCKTPSRGRDRSHVILTTNNGAIAKLHYANAMGFNRDQALPGCEELVKKYLQDDVM